MNVSAILFLGAVLASLLGVFDVDIEDLVYIVTALIAGGLAVAHLGDRRIG